MAQPRKIYHAYDRQAVNPADWDAFVDEQRDAWVWQRSWWLDYIKAYAPTSQERSFLVVDDQSRIRAIVPLVVQDGRAGYGHGDPCPGMVIATDRSMFERNAMVAMIFSEMKRRLQDISRGGWMWWANAPGARKWVKYCTATFPVQSVMRLHAVTDLTRSTDVLWASVRKSYRQTVDKWHGEIHSGDIDGYIAAHRAVSDRAEATYAMQRRWHQDGRIHAVTARLGGEPVGAAYALIDKGWAYYASGPSHAPNAQHAVQWRMVLDLKRKGVQMYELGSLEGETEKEQNIAFFKRGFGDDVRAVYGAVG